MFSVYIFFFWREEREKEREGRESPVVNGIVCECVCVLYRSLFISSIGWNECNLKGTERDEVSACFALWRVLTTHTFTPFTV